MYIFGIGFLCWLFINGLYILIGSYDLNTKIGVFLLDTLVASGIAVVIILGLGLIITTTPVIINKNTIQRPRTVFDIVFKGQYKIKTKDVRKIKVQCYLPEHINRIIISSDNKGEDVYIHDWYRQKDLNRVVNQLKVQFDDTILNFE